MLHWVFTCVSKVYNSKNTTKRVATKFERTISLNALSWLFGKIAWNKINHICLTLLVVFEEKKAVSVNKIFPLFCSLHQTNVSTALNIHFMNLGIPGCSDLCILCDKTKMIFIGFTTRSQTEYTFLSLLLLPKPSRETLPYKGIPNLMIYPEVWRSPYYHITTDHGGTICQVRDEHTVKMDTICL